MTLITISSDRWWGVGTGSAAATTTARSYLQVKGVIALSLEFHYMSS